MAEEKKCFIIMPISTPDLMLEKYRDGKDHFKHVLSCLFMASVQKAGYKAIPPIAKGADLIHAEIIHNLEMSEMVLCDMSCLNPNVFFEFGIRTSLNKPVCVVKDELTELVPFDTAILNYHEYKSSLEPWQLEAEINALSQHLTTSAERSKDENTLWKYFGLKTTAAPYEGEGGMETKLDYLSMKVDSLSKQIGFTESIGRPRIDRKKLDYQLAHRIIKAQLGDEVTIFSVGEHPDKWVVQYNGPNPSAYDVSKLYKLFELVFKKSLDLRRAIDLPEP